MKSVRSLRQQVATACMVLALALSAATQDLVRDFNQSPSTHPGSSHPSNFVPLPNGDLLLTLTTPRYGEELWRTDGTAAGTRLVADLQPGEAGSSVSQASFAEVSPGVFLFNATTVNEGHELWRTDGTPSGTWFVSDLWPGPMGSHPQLLTRVGNRVYFVAMDGVHGNEIWSTDGTYAGTSMLVELVPGPDGIRLGPLPIMALGTGEFVFSLVVSGGDKWELWKSDGTPAGTAIVTTFPTHASSYSWPVMIAGGRVIFSGGDPNYGLMVTDGTVAGTIALGTPPFPGDPQLAGRTVYFAAFDAATGSELWKTDGTPAGTQLVHELMPGGGITGSSSPSFVGELGGEIYFFATTPAGRGLYRSNGTPSGTIFVAPLGNEGTPIWSPNRSRRWGVQIRNELWFPIQSGTGPITNRLYRTNGSLSGTQLVSTLPAREFAAVGNATLFHGDDGTRIGREPYITDGTPGGTRLLVDLVPAPLNLGSNPIPIGSFQGQAIVIAEEPTTGRELWLSDGTPAGTRLLADIEPGPGSLSSLSVAANERRILILGSSRSSDRDPFFSDGTSAGTYQLDLFAPNSGFFANSPVAFGDRFLFAGSLPTTGLEPWITDGTRAGTFPILDLAAGHLGSNPSDWFAFGDRMLFRGRNVQRELWLFVTDGTSSGTQPLVRLDDDNFVAPTWAPTIFRNRVWFAAWTPSHGVELWSTDGTPAGTALEVDLEPGPTSSHPSTLAVAGAHLVVRARVGAWPRFFDVAPLGVHMIPLPMQDASGPYSLDANRVALGVRPDRYQNALQVWSYDGTTAGTVMIANFLSTPLDLRCQRLGNEYVIFSASDPVVGWELWSSTGNLNTAQAITSFDFGNSEPQNVVRAGDRLVFSADDGIHGQELFSLRFARTNDYVVEAFGSGCAGISGMIPTLSILGVPRRSIGVPFSIELARAAALSPALLLWSQERSPIDLPGCILWIGMPFGSIGAITDSSGSASMPITVAPEVVGERFRLQAFVWDPGSAAFGAASATQALELVIGR